jgi:hypothetical protein
MRIWRFTLICFALIVSALPEVFAAPPTSQPTASMYVEVYLRGEKRDVKVAGKLLEHDDERLVINAPGGSRELAWDQLTPNSAFTVKARLIDKTVANDWLALGKWGWEHGLEQQAKTALATARKLDTELGTQIDDVLSVEAGSKVIPLKPAAAPGIASKPASDGSTTAGPPTTAPAADADEDQDAVAQLTPGFSRGKPIIKYGPPTQEAIDKSMARSRKMADKARTGLGVDLVEIETDHFLIYTDWDKREYGFLKDKVEHAYKTLARQFNLPAADNVFVGKLPIYMFAKQPAFTTFARKIDGFGAPQTVLGYFTNTDEIGHMAMWKPAIGQGIGAGGSLDDAKRKWERTLTHEFSHAFFNRYKSNVNVPRWMNEGTAELISEMELPTNNYHGHARAAAMHQNIDIASLFDDSNMPSGGYYPVMMTMVEYLVKQDPKAFLALVNDIKDGAEPEDALEKHYRMRYARFEEVWKKYARALR